MVTVDTCILLTPTLTPKTIKGDVNSRYHGNSGYANASQCNIVRYIVWLVIVIVTVAF